MRLRCTAVVLLLCGHLSGAAASAAALPALPALPGGEPSPRIDDDSARPADPASPRVSLPPEPAYVDPFASVDDDEALAALRALEARVSGGEVLGAADRATLLGAARKNARAPIRSTAVAVLAWLPADVAGPPLVAALDDTDPRVRTFAAQGLQALARRLSDDVRAPAIERSRARLDDDDDEVACAAGELLAILAPVLANEAIRDRADVADPVRYACWGRAAGLPLKRVVVPPLPAAPDDSGAHVPPPTAPAPSSALHGGEWLFLTTAFGSGLAAGAFVPNAFLPTQEVLLYTARRTTLSHQEVSILTSAGAAIAGSLAFGGIAIGVDAAFGPPTLQGGSGAAFDVASAGMAGLGGALLAGRNEGIASSSLALSLAGGFGVSLLTAHLLEPTYADIGLATTTAALGALAGTLATFAAVPVGYATVYGTTGRVDFALGMVLTVGGLGGIAAMLLAPVIEVRPARLLAAAGGAVVGAAVGVTAGFLPVPVSVDVRQRIGTGAGLAGLVVGGALGAWLLPDLWLVPDAPSATPAALLEIENGALHIGAPSAVALAPRGRAAPGVSVSLFGGSL